jgi:phosphonoacetaldehyde hydrolase
MQQPQVPPLADGAGLSAVVFDWAGTTVDHGSRAPVEAFVELFARRGVTLDRAVARGPMGPHKRAHLARLCADPSVRAAWIARFGRAPAAADVDSLYADLEAIVVATLARFAEPIPGCLATIAALRARGVKIGSTTGYTRPMMDVLAPAAAARGYAPDAIVTSDEVAHARPWPDMSLRCLALLDAEEPGRCVKVDDTAAGIEEGVRAGMWTVGVVMTGNEAACSEHELSALGTEARARIWREGRAKLLAAGAHAVVPGIAQLEEAIAGLPLGRPSRAA